MPSLRQPVVYIDNLLSLFPAISFVLLKAEKNEHMSITIKYAHIYIFFIEKT